MAATVVPLLTLIHACDAVDDWTGSPTLDTEIFLQGTGALSAKVSKTTYTAMKPITAADLTGQKIYAWMNCATPALLDTKANGGMRIRIEDAAANWREWYVAGKDTYAGGWENFAVAADSGWDAQSATPPDITAVTAVGVVCVTTASVAKINFWWDVLRYGTGLRVKAGTGADPATWEDIYSADNATANKYGILTKYEGVYQLQGKLYIGSTTAGEATYFKDTGKIIIFRDKPFGVFYEVTIEGNATATTKVYFGEKSGGRGISGCIFNAAGASKYKITATDANITDLGLYGCLFIDADTISLPAYAATKEVLSCNFEKCAKVLADTCTVQYCNFVSADDRAVEMSSTTHNISDSNFISCPYGVQIPNTGTYTFNALMFSGNTTDIDNTSGGSVTVNCVNGSNPTTFTGDTTIVNTVYLTVWVEDEEGAALQGAAVRIERLSDNQQLMNEETDVTGKAEETYNYVGDENIEVRIRKSSSGEPARYFSYKTSGTITSGGYTLTAVLIKDEIAVP